MCNPSRGCGARSGTSSATDMEALTGLSGTRRRALAECGDVFGHRRRPPRRRHPHRTDGQHRAGGGDGERGGITHLHLARDRIILVYKTEHPYRYGVPYSIFDVVLYKICIVQIFDLMSFFVLPANFKCHSINLKVRNF